MLSRMSWLAITLSCLIFLPSCQSALNHSQQAETSQLETAKPRLGVISWSEIVQISDEFSMEYQNYQLEPADIQNFSRLEPYQWYVFFGFWCHDSIREVPRFVKLFQQAGFDSNQLKLVALGRDKQLPAEFDSQFKVRFTPTIFAIKDGQIIAKLEEQSRTTIAKDLLSQILH